MNPVMIAAAAAAALALTGAPGTAQDLHAIAAGLAEAAESPGAAVFRRCPGEPYREGVAGVRIKGGDAAAAPGDLWHMGSNTKAMTATLAARLVEQGAIDWDTSIGEALSATGLEIDPALAEATLSELLAHRAGLQANVGLAGMVRLAGADAGADYAADRRAYAQMVLARSGGRRGDFLYSNSGYVIAAVMLEERAGEPYEALMARHVFEPLGMDGAGWGPPGEAGRADQPRGHAEGWFGLSPREPGARADNPPAMNSAGRVHVPLADLAAFLTAHAERPSDYLTQDSWDRLHTPPAGDYALGWAVLDGGDLVHAGSNTMWFARMAVERETGCVAAAAVNRGGASVSEPVNEALRRALDR